MVLPIEQSQKQPVFTVELKTWQKVAFVVAGLISCALIGVGVGFSHTMLPQTAFYAVGGSVGGVTLFTLLVLLCVKKSQNKTLPNPPESLPKVQSRNSEPTFMERLFKHEEKDLTIEIETLKKEAFQFIESLDLPEEMIEMNDRGYSDKWGWDFPYTKKELREDFELTATKKRSQKEILAHMRKMHEALPYHLGLKSDSFSSFRTQGFPNVSGNSCFFNAGLQAIVHSRCVDYALLRPFIRSSSFTEPDPGPVVEYVEKPVPPEPDRDDPNWYQLHEKHYQERSRIEKENYKQYQNYLEQYCKKSNWDREHTKHLETVALFEKQSSSLNSGDYSQEQLLKFVEKLREGRSLTSSEVTTFLTHHGHTIGNKGAVSFLQSIINPFIPRRYHLMIEGYSKEKTEELILRPFTPVIVLNGQGHYKAYVRTKDEDAYHEEINDHTVTKRHRTSKIFLEEDEYRVWQPEFVCLQIHKIQNQKK